MKSTEQDQVLEVNKKNNYSLKSILESTWVIGLVVLLILLVSISTMFFYKNQQGTIFPTKESFSDVPSEIIFASDADQKENKSDRDAWGQTGDFFGGILNPIISLGALILLFWNVLLTKAELKETRNTLDRQLFESSFFNMITLHNNLVEDRRISPYELFDLSGMSHNNTFQNFIDNKDLKDISFFERRQVFGKIINYIVKNGDFEKILQKYEKFNNENNYILGHYFRNLYQILKILDLQNIGNTKKKRYANIFRAQLSSDELIILFINCLDDIVDNGEFRKLLVKFEILEHIPIKNMPYHAIYIQDIGDVPDKYLVQYSDHKSGKTAFGSNIAYSRYTSTPST
jgi:hypothetical protein